MKNQTASTNKTSLNTVNVFIPVGLKKVFTFKIHFVFWSVWFIKIMQRLFYLLRTDLTLNNYHWGQREHREGGGSWICGGNQTSVHCHRATLHLLPPSAPPACGMSRAPPLCFPASVRTTLKCCFRYPRVSPIKAAPSPQRYCFLRMIDWWMRADTSMKPFPLASLSDDVQRIFSIHASLLARVIPGTSFTPCSLKDLFLAPSPFFSPPLLASLFISLLSFYAIK